MDFKYRMPEYHESNIYTVQLCSTNVSRIVLPFPLLAFIKNKHPEAARQEEK